MDLRILIKVQRDRKEGKLSNLDSQGVFLTLALLLQWETKYVSSRPQSLL
jgi:hypothetical protein